jgi:hypothetical protein
MKDSSLNSQNDAASQSGDSQPAGLHSALLRLDRLLRAAVSSANTAGEKGVAADFYRGLEIRPEDVERALGAQPGQPLFERTGNHPDRMALAHDVPAFQWLAETFGLPGFDLDVILLTLAPEIDLRYERLYAYLQDDVTRKRPTVDLALNLFASDAAEKLVLRSRFAPDAPLQRHGLMRIFADPNVMQPPLLAYYLKLDEQIIRVLLRQSQLDSRLADFARLTVAEASHAEVGFDTALERNLAALAVRCEKDGRPLRLYFEGPEASGKLRAVDAVARAIDARVLTINLERAVETARDLPSALRVGFREAWLGGSVLFFDGVDAVRRDERSASWQTLLELLAVHPGVVILSGIPPWLPCDRVVGMLAIRFRVLDRPAAARVWSNRLKDAGLEIRQTDVELLADRFRLTSNQIADAVACAASRACLQATTTSSPGKLQVGIDELCAAARAESGHALGRLARKVEARYTWSDIVLPDEQLEQIREVCSQAKHWRRVFEDWGFNRKMSLGKGLNILFSGPPGTGKTMAAEVIASELKLDLYKIDLSQVVSKYIGETEKNLDRIFSAAENSNAILFFDEADALFGKRSEVKDSHDRYANIEIGYLLQKMEEYEGIAILATNVKHHIDEAFVRRMQAVIEFPFPEEAERRRVWQVAFPEEAPISRDVDFGALARAVRLAGGNIRNIARLAAFLAAADGGVIAMPHLVKASRREYQKLGRTWNENEWKAGLEASSWH